ncbi:Retrovirus-related Pol polyprotein from transposon 17.6 [Labeo rohita]|uniref:ribonuclease H n=1 Tax=Labeo rohita TaxID=84645 RepID=A0ABQ8LKH8_LABRO|nr:Retrovirus-related Pol polyprotein from transposon 17.6 [Labeo rohita]
MAEGRYRMMPRVEQTLATYLSPDSASSLKAPVLPSRVPAPHTGRLKSKASLLVLLRSRTETSGARSRGLRSRGPTCGSCCRLRSPRRSGPDHYGSGPLRAAPTGEERGAPHSTVSVSPQCPQETVLLTLPVFHFGSPGSIAGTSLFQRTVSQVVSQIRSEDWFVTIDLKDAYFDVSILPRHRKFLRFALRGEAHQYQVLPFGLALSPRTFTKCVDAALAPLRFQGIRILNYIDDWLILAQLEQMAVQHRDAVLAYTKELGLRLNAKKSVLSPLQRTTYLGVVWDSTTMQARLSPARIETILTAVARVKEGRSLTVKQFQQLLGLMAAASNVIRFGLLYMRPLQWWLRTNGFSPRGNPFRMIKGPVFGVLCRHVTLATDASLTGCGAVMDGHPAHGLWSGRHLSWHINCLEMLAVFQALKPFLPDLIGCHVLVLLSQAGGTRRCVSGHTSSIPASIHFFLKAECQFRRMCFYASWSVTSPARDVSPLYWTDYM